VEAKEEVIENWWFRHYAKGVDTDLNSYLCVNRMKGLFYVSNSLPNRRQRCSDCTVLMATVNGERQILTPYRIKTPKPIDKNICIRDYVQETTRYAKFGANPYTGASVQIGEI